MSEQPAGDRFAELMIVLWSGHTVPNGDPPEPYAPNTKLCGALIAPPVAVWPLHADEMELKLDKGLEAL